MENEMPMFHIGEIVNYNRPIGWFHGDYRRIEQRTGKIIGWGQYASNSIRYQIQPLQNRRSFDEVYETDITARLEAAHA